MPFPFSRALVTGGAGFIGSHLVQELLARGVSVVSVDNYVGGKRENLAGMPNPNLLTQAECDVTELAKLRRLFDGVEVVFHNAASKKLVCLRDPRRDLEVNALGTLNVLELAVEFKVRKVVHASTGSVYGEACRFPQDETHPLAPCSFYGVSKLAGEKYVSLFHHEHRLNTTVLRYFHVYGPRQESGDDRGGVVAIFCRRALAGLPLHIHSDGLQQRSFTFVKDVVRANFLVATDPRAAGEAYNCASGLKITVLDLAQAVQRLAHSEHVPLVHDASLPGDIRVVDIDHTKLQTLGLTDWTQFEKGLKWTFEWYQNRP